MNAFARKFLVEDFDFAPLPAAEPVVTECRCPRCAVGALPLCRGAAWEEGRRAGLEERVAVEGARVAGLEATLREALRGADAAAAEIAEVAAEAVGRAVIALATAALPASFAALGPREAQRVAAAVLAGLHGEMDVTVTAAPEAAVLLEGMRATQEGTRVRVVSDPASGPGDVRVAWQNGRSVRDGGQTLARVRDVLSSFGLGPEIAVNANENGGFVACQQDIGELAHG